MNKRPVIEVDAGRLRINLPSGEVLDPKIGEPYATMVIKALASPDAASAGMGEPVEALKLVDELESAMNQFRHAQRQGPWWWTNGESALRSHVNVWLDKADAAIASIKAALAPSIPSAGAVKGLEWRVIGDLLQADTSIGWYLIKPDDEPGFTHALSLSTNPMASFASEDAAKAAAQADYEARILSALSPAPQEAGPKK